MSAIHLLWEFRAAFWGGLTTTLALLAIALATGTVAGVGLAIGAEADKLRLVRPILNAVSFAALAIPALVILFWVHYPGQQLLGVRASGFTSAAVTLSLLNALAVYRMALDAAEGFPRQFVQAARVTGLSARTTFVHIYAPVLIRSALPRWIDQQVFILHCTLLASFISVEETFRVAQRINSSLYQPVLIYTALAVLFLAVGGAALALSGRLRRRYSRDWSEK